MKSSLPTWSRHAIARLDNCRGRFQAWLTFSLHVCCKDRPLDLQQRIVRGVKPQALAGERMPQLLPLCRRLHSSHTGSFVCLIQGSHENSQRRELLAAKKRRMGSIEIALNFMLSVRTAEHISENGMRVHNSSGHAAENQLRQCIWASADCLVEQGCSTPARSWRRIAAGPARLWTAHCWQASLAPAHGQRCFAAHIIYCSADAAGAIRSRSSDTSRSAVQGLLKACR